LPDQQVHLRKATENETLASQLDLSKPSAPNWAITMSFYSAVHYVEAYFFKRGKNYRLHTERGSAIRRDGRIKDIWRQYSRLQDASENARYEKDFFTDAQFAKIRPNLEEIKRVITPLL
jgi:hypothetical protein